MPSLVQALGSAAVLLAVATSATAHFDDSPIHLKPMRATMRRRAEASAATSDYTAGSLPPAKQDCTYTTNAFHSNSFQSLLQENMQAATEAIQEGKNEPAVVDTQMVKRAQPGPSWRFDFSGKNPVRGVNLGGWLVLEPWITPSLFLASGQESIVDEYTFCQGLGKAEAARRLKKHWDTWIVEKDFAEIASLGLNHVRIPIGFWAFDVRAGEPYVSGQWPYLLKAIRWAQKYGVKVMVDVHGAPGSQNGFDNSGRRGSVLWHTQQENVNRTLDVVSKLAKEFAKPKYASTVTVLQALNEPAGFVSPDVVKVYRQFAYDSYGRVRYPTGSHPSDVVLSLHDAFQPLSVWSKSFPSPQFSGVALSDHPYFVFNEPDLRLTDQQHIKAVCGMSNYYAQSQQSLWTLIDEFSGARTDCAQFLNGRGIGARYDGTYPGSTAVGSCKGKTGKGSTFSNEYKTTLAKSWAVQTQVWEKNTSGWVSWCWKNENADDWSYKAGVQYGWIPKDPKKPIYPNLCASA
ncbi:hypothetical protein JCM10212_005214 [Sporobolomyces blumeae]